jgi:hypothetical protein
VLLVLFPGVGSFVLSLATVAVLLSVVGSATEDATVTCTVNVLSAPDARLDAVQVTVPAAAVQPAPLWNVTPAGSVSVTWKPALSDGPLLWTVIV